MHHQSHATTPSPHSPHPTRGGSRWLVVAVSLCGAMAGASIVEALAALASRASTPVSPDHLIAAPLALVGALCGGLLAAVLVSKDHQTEASQANVATEMLIPSPIMPSEPMVWQPTPYVISSARRSATTVTQSSHSALHSRRLRRAIRQRGYSHHNIHDTLARPAMHR